jgi:hypothetical protein
VNNLDSLVQIPEDEGPVRGCQRAVRFNIESVIDNDERPTASLDLPEASGGSTGTGVEITRQLQAAISAFPWSLGVHICAIPLGDATFDS